MLFLNLIKLIHPGFLKNINIQNRNIKSTDFPDGFLQDKEYINIDTILATSCFPDELFDNSRIVVDFRTNLKQSIAFENIQENALDFQIPLLLLCISVKNAHEVLRSWCITGNISIDELHNWSVFIYYYQEELKDPNDKEELLRDIVDFLDTLLTVAEQHDQCEFTIFTNTLKPFAPHLCKALCDRLTVLALYPKQEEMMFELQQIHFPPLRLLDHPLKSQKISTSLFQQITIQCLPKNIDLKDWPFLLEFYRFVWKLPLFPHRLAKDINVGVCADGAEGGWQVLVQLVCFLLPNWYQVWTEMNFSTSTEVQRRLWLLKKNKWIPPIKEYTKLLLNKWT
jgi:hypothetical protein